MSRSASPRSGERGRRAGRFDVLRFVLISTFLGALELVLDRGLDDDWFGSNFIVGMSAICGLAFVLMVPREMTWRDPMTDLRMVATRQFGASFTVMLATGAILCATTQFLPLLVQTDFGYTATWAGLVLSPGVVTLMMMFGVGRQNNLIQPNYLISAGMLSPRCRCVSPPTSTAISASGSWRSRACCRTAAHVAGSIVATVAGGVE
jgi:MFS transporter, DHA2 family, multidrug resistance protein